jgi:hypothetical protein
MVHKSGQIRLEARWAVFYDALGIEWRYEPEGFDLGEHGWYLPDFYLPEHKSWIEIKPDPPSTEDKLKIGALFDLQPWEGPSQDVFIFFGDIPYPYPKQPNAHAAFLTKWDPEHCWMQCPLCGDIHIDEMNTMSCSKGCEDEVHAALVSGIYELMGDQNINSREEVGRKLRRAMHETEFFGAGHKGEKLRKAYEAARSARFEQNHLRPIR